MSYEPENPTPDLGFDAQAWLARELERISSEFNVVRVESIGRAGLLLSASTPDTTLITQTPTKITGYDSIVEPSKNAEANLTNSTIRVLSPGLWLVMFSAVIRITPHSSNTSRGVIAQLYNDTTSVTYKVLSYSPIARYQDIVSFTISIGVNITEDVLGDEFALFAASTTTASIQITQLEILEFEVVQLVTL